MPAPHERPLRSIAPDGAGGRFHSRSEKSPRGTPNRRQPEGSRRPAGDRRGALQRVDHQQAAGRRVATLAENGVAGRQRRRGLGAGAFEIPLAAARMAESGRYLAVICLGAVIRGETTHDQHINRAVSVAIEQIARQSGLPVLFGVLTCDTLEQAIHRSGGNVGNKGSECAAGRAGNDRSAGEAGVIFGVPALWPAVVERAKSRCKSSTRKT